MNIAVQFSKKKKIYQFRAMLVDGKEYVPICDVGGVEKSMVIDAGIKEVKKFLKGKDD